jgi:hypothetical protein
MHIFGHAIHPNNIHMDGIGMAWDRRQGIISPQHPQITAAADMRPLRLESIRCQARTNISRLRRGGAVVDRLVQRVERGSPFCKDGATHDPFDNSGLCAIVNCSPHLHDLESCLEAEKRVDYLAASAPRMFVR